MKRQLLSALALTITTITISSTAVASDFPSGDSLHRTRLEQLDIQSKAIGNIQQARLDRLYSQNKTVDSIHKTRLEQLDSRAKDASGSNRDCLDRISNSTVSRWQTK